MSTAIEDLVAEMTIGELAKRSGRTVEAITSWALGGRSSRAASNGAPRGGGGVNTRTPAGREAFDEAVLQAIRGAGGEVQAADLAAIVGGNALQRRTALQRLVKRRKLRRAGQARATSYALR
jgi:hypothetical protein